MDTRPFFSLPWTPAPLEYSSAPISSHNFISVNNIPNIVRHLYENHRIIVVNVVEGTALHYQPLFFKMAKSWIWDLGFGMCVCYRIPAPTFDAGVPNGPIQTTSQIQIL